MASKKESAKNSKKRDKPEEKEWHWDDTQLKDSKDAPLTSSDVKELLKTRGCDKKKINGKKEALISLLKDEFEVDLKEPLSELTVSQLRCELRLRGIDDSSAKKELLIQRLKGEIDGEPQQKKPKKARKTKNGVWVALYSSTAENDVRESKILGVFRSEPKAYEKGIDQLICDMVEKYGDKNKKKAETAEAKIHELPLDECQKRMTLAQEAVDKAWNKSEDAPYVEILESKVE